MNDTITIAVIPLDIAQADKEANLRNVVTLMQSVDPATDVVVLPELFSTGFIADPQEMRDMSETNTGNTIDTMRRLAARHNMAICGSFLAKTGSSYYNRAFFIEPSGDETFFDKRHLFALSLRKRDALAGPRQIAPDPIPGMDILDRRVLRHPVSRLVPQHRHAYDVMLVPANWPQSRRFAWEHLLIGRAIENQAYYIGADRSGNDAYGCYDDMTVTVDFYGRNAGVRDESTGITYVTADRHTLEKARKSMPTMLDADIFTIDQRPRRENDQNDS